MGLSGGRCGSGGPGLPSICRGGWTRPCRARPVRSQAGWCLRALATLLTSLQQFPGCRGPSRSGACGATPSGGGSPREPVPPPCGLWAGGQRGRLAHLGGAASGQSSAGSSGQKHLGPVWVPPAWRGRVSAELEVVGLGCWELQRPREQRPSRSLFKLLASVGASRLKAGLYRGPGARPSFPRGSSGSLALFTGLPCSRRFLVSRKDKERGQRLCGRPCPPLAAGGQCLRWDLARRGAEGREGVPPPRPAPGSGCGSATGVGGEHRRAWSPRDPTRGAFH